MHSIAYFWIYYMWKKVVGPALEDINLALNPENSDQVEAEIYLYVHLPRCFLSTRVICTMRIMCINWVNCIMWISLHTMIASVNRLKSDGASTSKKVKVLGKGLLTLVDHVFWNLPSPTSSNPMMLGYIRFFPCFCHFFRKTAIFSRMLPFFPVLFRFSPYSPDFSRKFIPIVRYESARTKYHRTIILLKCHPTSKFDILRGKTEE